ncbi:MAG: PhoU domain-containing protein, partial [Myxococcota bacterium]|nr:PhoU domain-containing protein [Myxococcota bacterium]
IAKSAERLADRSRTPVPERLRDLADDARRQLRLALDAFSDRDSGKAAEVLAEEERVDADQDQVIREALEEIATHPELSSQEVDFILVAKHLERVGDHATNIAEDVILAATAKNVKHADKLAEARRR